MGEHGVGSLLLVEDEDRLRGLVAQFLRGEGFEVVEAGDGLQGVERFTDSGPFDLVLLDVMLRETETPQGPLNSKPPAPSREKSRPFGPAGVWHSMQCAMVAR